MTEQLIVLSVLSFVFSFVSAICAAINLWLIHSMQQWNMFLLILWNVCWYQIVYDLFFYLDMCVVTPYLPHHIFNSTQAFGGLGVCLWLNVLCLVLLDIIVCRKRAEFMVRYQTPIKTGVFVIVFAFAVAEALCSTDCVASDYSFFESVYYWLRAGSVAFSFLSFGFIYLRVSQMVPHRTVSATAADMPVYVLSRRMMYYPIVQFLTRIANSVYEQVYGFEPYYAPSNVSSAQFGLRVLVAITQPSAGIGFLLVFLLFQPKARETLWSSISDTRAGEGRLRTTVTADRGNKSTTAHGAATREETNVSATGTGSATSIGGNKTSCSINAHTNKFKSSFASSFYDDERSIRSSAQQLRQSLNVAQPSDAEVGGWQGGDDRVWASEYARLSEVDDEHLLSIIERSHSNMSL